MKMMKVNFFSSPNSGDENPLKNSGENFSSPKSPFFIFKKYFFSFFFSPRKMRFSIQEPNEKKMFFHVPSAAQKATGLNLTTIKTILERGNPNYHRKSDNKLFVIRKEDPIKIATIEGEDFFSLEDIQTKFELSPTKFLNQVKNGKFAKKIDWISDELFQENEEEKEDEMSLREEINSRFRQFQAEIDRLSSRVEKLEKEKVELLKKLSSPPPEAEEEKEAVPKAMEKATEKEQKTTEKEQKTTEKAMDEEQKMREEWRAREKKQKAENEAKYPIREKPIFKASKTLSRETFQMKKLASFIRYGIVGKIIIQTPKKEKYVLLDEKREYLPNLVEEIIITHIHPEMGVGDEEKAKEFSERMAKSREEMCKGSHSSKAFKTALASAMMLGRIRRLDPETVHEIANEVMKII